MFPKDAEKQVFNLSVSFGNNLCLCIFIMSKSMGGIEMGNSIGKKVTVFITGVCILMVLMCALNLAAWSTTSTYFEELSAAFDATGVSADASVQELFRKTSVKISGTYIFNIILIVVGVLVFTLDIVLLHLTISKPAQKTNAHLIEIVKGIENNEGDLTQRIISH